MPYKDEKVRKAYMRDYLRDYMRRQRAEKATGKQGKSSDEALKRRIRELEADLGLLRKRIKELEATPGGRRQAAADPEIDRSVEARVLELQQERDKAVDQCWTLNAYLELRTKGIFTRAEYKKLLGFFHPDKAPRGEAEQKRFTEAFNLVRRCEKLLKDEPLPQPPPLPTGQELRQQMREGRLRVLKGNRARGLKAAETRRRKKARRQIAP